MGLGGAPAGPSSASIAAARRRINSTGRRRAAAPPPEKPPHVQAFAARVAAAVAEAQAAPMPGGWWQDRREETEEEAAERWEVHHQWWKVLGAGVRAELERAPPAQRPALHRICVQVAAEETARVAARDELCDDTEFWDEHGGGEFEEALTPDDGADSSPVRPKATHSALADTCRDTCTESTPSSIPHSLRCACSR